MAEFINETTFRTEWESVSKGLDGFSPEAEVTKQNGTVTFTVTDAEHTTTVKLTDGDVVAGAAVNDDGHLILTVRHFELDGSYTDTAQDCGKVRGISAYEFAKLGGYTGTMAEYEALMNNFSSTAADVAEQAAAAELAKQEAEAAAVSATVSETNAIAKAGEAATSAANALASKNAAAASASNASQSATSANNSESAARGYSQTAETKAGEAAASATEAGRQSTSAAASATAAGTSASSAATSAGNAATSATEAANSAGEARAKANEVNNTAAAFAGDISGINTAIENIRSAAGNAQNTADDAQRTANTAVTNAANAQTAAETAQGAAITAQSTAENAQSTASAAQATAEGKVSKSGDTMTGGLGIGKQSATDTSDGCYFGTGGAMYFRRTNGNPFIAFYKGSGDKRQFIQGTDVAADVYLNLPTTGGTLATTNDINNKVYNLNINQNSSVTIDMTGYSAITCFCARNATIWAYHGNTWSNGAAFISTMTNMTATMSGTALTVTNNNTFTVKLHVIKG